MKKEVEQFFCQIKQKLPKNISLVEEIASVLDINYDAAYRRINNKTELSFKEALCLAKFYKISLNTIYSFKENESIIVQKDYNFQTNNTLESFFIKSNKLINHFGKLENSEILYTAKDIPLYYFPQNSLIQKFKIYSLLNLPYSKENINKREVTFEAFSISSNLIYESICFKNAFKKVNCTEIWNDNTINSNLYEIYYCFKIKLINQEQAIQLCDELKLMTKSIENKIKNESLNKNSNVKSKMYYSKLASLDNAVIFNSKKTKTLLIPYIQTSYLRIDDELICEETIRSFNKKIQLSKKVSGDAEIERKIFFSSMYQKINSIYNQIKNEDTIFTL
ncbi:hypothetical protein [Tenacibaculum sp. nBUS_03]|uniref:hypothetical protein n=1 Tax=Tenacibaculum sp. nBUS_03 TaxID=3395320 RepID=UPI003EB96E52